MLLNDESFVLKIPLNIITHGLAFHPEVAIDPEPPYTPEAYPIIREMVEQRSSVLLEAAETIGTGKKNQNPISNKFKGIFIWSNKNIF